ncbi:MAG: patatin-like phospholipase family protein [Flavobacteriales bacterium]|nr:patatin-like phospholipase family protein [Flavobacteriales bacterium]
MHDVIIDHGDSKGSAEKWSATEKFFDAPNSTANRVYRPDKFGEERSEHNWDNYPEVLSMLKRWGKGFIADGLHQYFFPITKYYRKWANILKRLVLRDDLQSDKQRSIGFDRLPMPFPVPYAYPTNRNVEFKHHNDAAAYLHSLLLNRGLFSGFAARDFFRELIKTQLVAARFKAYKNYEAPDGDMSFKEFYNITGVDLVLTGVNISRHEPRYFSVWHTPDFPVVEAVALSMSIPFAFKPVYIEGGVRKGDQAQNLAYQGLYVDGGMLNNYPVRAFDTIALRSSLSNGELLRYRNEEISGGAFSYRS